MRGRKEGRKQGRKEGRNNNNNQQHQPTTTTTTNNNNNQQQQQPTTTNNNNHNHNHNKNKNKNKNNNNHNHNHNHNHHPNHNHNHNHNHQPQQQPQPTNTNQPTKQPTNQPSNQTTNQLTNQPTNHPSIHPSIHPTTTTTTPCKSESLAAKRCKYQSKPSNPKKREKNPKKNGKKIPKKIAAPMIDIYHILTYFYVTDIISDARTPPGPQRPIGALRSASPKGPGSRCGRSCGFPPEILVMCRGVFIEKQGIENIWGVFYNWKFLHLFGVNAGIIFRMFSVCFFGCFDDLFSFLPTMFWSNYHRPQDSGSTCFKARNGRISQLSIWYVQGGLNMFFFFKGKPHIV